MTQPHEMQISERELLVMTADLEERHQATLPLMHEAVGEWKAMVQETAGKAGRRVASRRTFLLGAGALTGGIALAACGKKSTSSSTSTTAAGDSGALTGDFAVAGLAAGLENLAVNTYQAALDAATAGKLGTVPPAVATFAKTAQSQHRDHAAAWNAILTGAGKKAVTGVDTTVRDGVVTPGFAQVKDVVGLAKLALVLENAAAATYLSGIGALTNSGAIKTAASIQPVEMQHAAILNFVLGNYPVPDSFAKTDGARPASDQIG